MSKKFRNLTIALICVIALAIPWGNRQVQLHKAPEMYQDDNIFLISRIEGNRLQVYQEGKWQDLFVKGVNLGTALPGRWFTEFPASSAIYSKWFEQIAAMNANCIRVYTLLDPVFYDSLYRYNRLHPEQPLYLLQGIWPQEHPPQDNLLDSEYLQAFKKEIDYTLDAVHGRANIAERRGRAYGKYKRDVSPYVLAYLPGRELEPQEILATDKANSGYRFRGQYFMLQEGTPSEAFLALTNDYIINYEEKTYGWQHPLASVSWPTLDPIEHDSEWNSVGKKSLEYNDCAQLDINHIDISPQVKAGFFGAYHIYPNYPDFMNNEPSYDNYRDEQGRLRYGGYLREFIQQHQKYPALVAEFGLATGLGNAHYNPDGYHHGSLTEEEQGVGIARMIKAIEREGYMGGVIFEWMDEWTKKTWTTEPFMIPYEKHVYWHNMVDAEQNYGILAMESQEPKRAAYKQKNQGYIKKLEMKVNESYLYIDIYSQENIDFSTQRWWIGLDSYARQRGDKQFPGREKLPVPSGMEFIIKLEGKEAGNFTVIPSYNPTNYRFSSQATNKGYYEEIRPVINKARVTKNGTVIPEIRAQGSSLRFGDFKTGNSHWFYEGNKLSLRIPWTSLNVSDPTTHQVLDDSRSGLIELERDMLKTTTTEGIVPYVLVESRDNRDIIGIFPGKDKFTEMKPYLWSTWREPDYQQRLKASHSIIKEAFTSTR